MPVPPAPDEAWARAVQAFDAGRWFEAHEHLEDLWRQLPHGKERDFVQGVLHVAVALYQRQRGNERGARSQQRKAERKLQGRYRGVEATVLLASLANALDAPRGATHSPHGGGAPSLGLQGIDP